MKTNLLRTSYFVPLYIFLFLCTFFGCKKGNTPETLQGSPEKPAWTAPANYDLASSMTAVIKVDLSSCYTAEQLSTVNYQLSTDDMLAAFSGDELVGVAEPLPLQGDGGQEEGLLFFLYICAPTKGEDITLKYYSSVLKNIFIAEPFAFANDTQLGSIANPYMPQFTI